MQGDDSTVFDNEQPAHAGQINSFWMGGTAVSELLWAVVMGGDLNRASAEHAKVDVSWLDAIYFCNALSRRCGLQEVYNIPNGTVTRPQFISFDYQKNGYRLPTESEWEYAARGTMRGLDQMPKGVDVEHMNDFPIPAQDISTAAYSGSDLIKEVCWFVDNSREKKPMQAQKRANAFGLYDMSGNVFEWVWDYYGQYSGTEATNPVGPEGGMVRGCRGGGWNMEAKFARSSRRMRDEPSVRSGFIGLRLVRKP